jgi:hypothetical protein
MAASAEVRGMTAIRLDAREAGSVSVSGAQRDLYVADEQPAVKVARNAARTAIRTMSLGAGYRPG